MRVLSDADVDRVPMARLVAAVREQIIADAQGEAVAPPRHVVPFREGSLVFTIGGDRRLAGFRAYQTFARPGHSADTQVVAAWDQVKAEMLGLALGNRLGALRTGAIGGAAADILAPKARAPRHRRHRPAGRDPAARADRSARFRRDPRLRPARRSGRRVCRCAGGPHRQADPAVHRSARRARGRRCRRPRHHLEVAGDRGRLGGGARLCGNARPQRCRRA
jgi:hypothetical protein